MEPSDNSAASPSFSMLDLSVFDHAVEYAFMYNSVRFFVTIAAEKLGGQGNLLHEFNNFKDDIDNPDTMFQFEEWVLAALDDFMRRVAPTPEPWTRKPVTLLEFFSPPAFAFELVNDKGNLCAIQEDYNPQIHGDLSPRTRIVASLPDSKREPSSSAQNNLPLPASRDNPNDSPILFLSALPPVPLIPASELERVDNELHDYELSDVPKRVRRRGWNHTLFFKAGFKNHGHVREMELLSQISRSGKFDAPFRTSRLVGLVVWDDDGDGHDMSLMGFLLEYIDGETLELRMDGASTAMRMKWIGQVEATVKRLHEVGIVWGDVKPDNIIINADEDAVVVDFGGGYTPEYIPEELQQTVQGDLLGLDHLRAAMGLRHKG